MFLICFLKKRTTFIVFGTNYYFWLNCLFNRCPLINSSSSVFDQHLHQIVLWCLVMLTLIQQLRKTNRRVSVLFFYASRWCICGQVLSRWKDAIFHLGQCGHGRPWHGIRVWFLFRYSLTAAVLQMIAVARSANPIPLWSHPDFLL